MSLRNREKYFAAYKAKELEDFASTAWRLEEEINYTLFTYPGNLAEAYQDALKYALSFKNNITEIATLVSCPIWSCRPGTGVKDAHRILEKAAKYKGTHVPSDMLGAKFVVTSLNEAYRIAAELPQHLDMIDFEDRFFKPQLSGYRDLKF